MFHVVFQRVEIVSSNSDSLQTKNRRSWCEAPSVFPLSATHFSSYNQLVNAYTRIVNSVRTQIARNISGIITRTVGYVAERTDSPEIFQYIYMYLLLYTCGK